MLSEFLTPDVIKVLDLAPIVGNMEQSFEMLQEQTELSDDELGDAIDTLTCYGVLDGRGKDCWWFDMDNKILKAYLKLNRLVWVQDNRMSRMAVRFIPLK